MSCPIEAVFDQPVEAIEEIQPGHAIVIKKNGHFSEAEVRTPATERASCSFERIYFSRGNDPEIYNERKALG